MQRLSVKTIAFEGTKISNLDELVSIANGLHEYGWCDYYNSESGVAFSQRSVSGWLKEEDAVIMCPIKNLTFSKCMEGRWYRFHGLVVVTETFGSHLKQGQHMVAIQPLVSTFDVIDSEEEPDGRKDRYKDFPKYVRDSVNEVTLEAPHRH